ncbi:MAG: radical SAM protein [Candidatus Pacearchaeota archaeon]|jgi:MoaA/NifB/PqqE/SkfB family radical SAM enzyme
MEKIKFKIREEKQGALLFDQEKGSVKQLDEKQYQDFLKKNTSSIRLFKSSIQRKQLPADCLSAPSKVYFELTRKCNLNCKYCYNKSSFAFSKELSKEKIFSVLNELAQAGTFEIRFTGGEPTLHKDFFEILAYAESLGFFVSLGTNGVWNQKTINQIKSSNIKIIIISLDGPKEYNDSIRGEGTFDRVIETLKQLREKKDLFLKINCVLTKNNKKYLEEVVKIAVSLGVNVVNFVPVKLAGRGNMDKIDSLSKEDMFMIVAEITNLRKKYNLKIQTYFDILDECECSSGSLLNQKACGAGIEVAAISPFGEVYGCVVSPASELEDSEAKKMFTAGNLDQDNIMKIWLDSSRWIFRDLTKSKCEKCLKCEFYTKKCFGNCIVDSYLQNGQINSADPNCFMNLIEV